MNQREMQMVELLGSNRAVVAKSFKLEVDTDIANAALVWTMAGRQATVEEMRANFDHLKRQASALSVERSMSKLALVSRMALSGDGAAYLAEVQRIFGKIMEGKKMQTSSRFGAAMLIANSTRTPEEADRLLERSQGIFARMSAEHPVITSDQDLMFAVIVAMSDRDDDELLSDAEECYKLLGDGYKLTEGRQSMAHVLALSPLAPAEKVARVQQLRDALKQRKISVGWVSSQEYVTLALLALDERPVAEIADEMAELSKLIKKQKGFGSLSATAGIRLLYAATISMSARQGDDSAEAISDAVSLAIAEAILSRIVYMTVIIPIV